MRITLRVGSTDYVLADGVTRAIGVPFGPTSVRGSFPVVTQDKLLLDAAFSEPVARGNMATRFQFGSEIEFASLEAAELYFLTGAQQFPRSGKMRFQLVDAAGNLTVLEMTKAVIEDIAVSHEGRAVELNFSVKGGGIGNVTPD